MYNNLNNLFGRPYLGNQGVNQNSNQNVPQINEQDLRRAICNLDQATLIQLVQQARANGIPDSEIEKGLNFLLQSK